MESEVAEECDTADKNVQRLPAEELYQTELDALISTLSEKRLSVPELGLEVPAALPRLPGAERVMGNPTLFGVRHLSPAAFQLRRALAAADMEIGTKTGFLPEGVARTSVQDDSYRQLKELRLEKYRTAQAQRLDLDPREKLNVKSEQAALNRRAHSPLPSASAIGFPYTIRRSLQNYNPELKAVIPERVYFFDRSSRVNRWHIILDIDQSGSMGQSIIYSSIMACTLASMPAVKTSVVAFDTQIMDLPSLCARAHARAAGAVSQGPEPGGTGREERINWRKKARWELPIVLFGAVYSASGSRW